VALPGEIFDFYLKQKRLRKWEDAEVLLPIDPKSERTRIVNNNVIVGVKIPEPEEMTEVETAKCPHCKREFNDFSQKRADKKLDNHLERMEKCKEVYQQSFRQSKEVS